ncbi:DUF362 domain-containing protein [Sunxiuqinia sp. A32]|uniref:DUF362 domain-containing protein n=1 Tax=Sunxiuqinia sp. A32 TaxID=3461496 RepID=UPI004045C042
MKKENQILSKLLYLIDKLKPIWSKVWFWGIGLVATIWFLVRVIPKPSRATYPCQRAAFPIASAFVIGILGVRESLVKRFPRQGRFLLSRQAVLVLITAVVLTASFEIGVSGFPEFVPRPAWVPTDSVNSPMGEAKGIFPGRVTWIRDSLATRWNSEFGEGHWWEDKYTDQERVCAMMNKSLLALTGTATAPEAWGKIFTFHNKSHNKGNKGYQNGQTIAVKINCNNAYEGYGDVDNQIDASKQTVLGILRQLVNEAKIDQKDILVYEAIRVISDHIYKPCHEEFPEVRWMDSKGDGTNGRLPVVWRENTIEYSGKTNCGAGIPQLVYEADYIVNMTLVKGHPSVGITLTAKNHYGTINEREHSFKPNEYHPFVDLIASKYLGGKTVLYMLDGLYGIRDVNDPVTREYAGWYHLFGGDWLSSIFMSLDPLAIDAVGYDFLRAEFGDRLGRGRGAPTDIYMHEAALADNPPSGFLYKQDGERLQSLGVHEHWNNSEEKQYTHNLKEDGKGVELFTVR